MEYKNILVSTKENVGIINLNQPQNMNLVDFVMLSEIASQIKLWENDRAIRVIIIASEGKVFSSGIDIKELSTNINAPESNFQNMQEAFSAIFTCKKPIIAAVNGYALGVGLEIALACDFILASDNAKFAHPEISLNMIPCFGGIQRLLRTIGKSKTMEMVLTGRALSAEEAERAGIVSRIVPLFDLLDDAIKTAQRIANQSPKTVRIAKEVINSSLVGLESGIASEKGQSKLCLLDVDFKQSLLNLHNTGK